VAVPADIPVTRPPPLIVATPVLLLLHAPPPVPSLSAVVDPTHTLIVPPMPGGPDVTDTVIVDVQLPPREYVITAVPVFMPVTIPVV
jgi:hypothetical protein